MVYVSPQSGTRKKKRIQRICDFLWKNRKGDTDTIYQIEKDAEWLKFLPICQKQEDDWTEDDEKHLQRLCGIIRHARVTYKELSLKEEVELGEWVDKWLNHSPNPQPHWKPSEEQMKMLAMFANLRCASNQEANVLESLYKDLKKL